METLCLNIRCDVMILGICYQMSSEGGVVDSVAWVKVSNRNVKRRQRCLDNLTKTRNQKRLGHGGCQSPAL